MIDVVAVVLDTDSAIKYVLAQYVDSSYEPAAPTVPASESPIVPASEFKLKMSRLGFEPDPIKMAQWVYPTRWRMSAIRFQSDVDLNRMQAKLPVPGATATFMDTADYEAWLVMLKLAEA